MGATLPCIFFPEESAAVQDSPRLVLIILNPDTEWQDDDQAPERIGRWTKERGNSPRLYPGSLVWCARKPGRELREKVEVWLAWQRVAHEVAAGVLGPEFDRTEQAEVRAKVKDAEEAAKDEVWASYRFVALSDTQKKNGLNVIDLGAGHASASETLCGRIISALKSEALLNENVGAGYIDRHWPPAFKDTGAWPLTSLRQSFLDGSLTRLIDPDTIPSSADCRVCLEGRLRIGVRRQGRWQLRSAVVYGTAPLGRGSVRDRCLLADQDQSRSIAKRVWRAARAATGPRAAARARTRP